MEVSDSAVTHTLYSLQTLQLIWQAKLNCPAGISVCQKKFLTCLIWSCMESLGNDDVSIVYARKYEMVRMT